MAKYIKPKLDTATFYFPHGDMCVACPNVHKDCSSLPFTTMKPILRYYGEDNSAAVKCQEFRS